MRSIIPPCPGINESKSFLLYARLIALLGATIPDGIDRNIENGRRRKLEKEIYCCKQGKKRKKVTHEVGKYDVGTPHLLIVSLVSTWRKTRRKEPPTRRRGQTPVHAAGWDTAWWGPRTEHRSAF
jgi:hypothetical protein